MPQPNGYRKALRFMRHADKFGFPIITFVDTPGAYAGKNAEELGQVLVFAIPSLSNACPRCRRSQECCALWAGKLADATSWAWQGTCGRGGHS